MADFHHLNEEFLQNVAMIVGNLIWADPKLRSGTDKDHAIQHMDHGGARFKKWVDTAGAKWQWQITAVFCGSLVGNFLPVHVVYQSKTPRCHPKYQFSPVSGTSHTLPNTSQMRKPWSGMREDNHPLHPICKSFLQWWHPCVGDYGQFQGPDLPLPWQSSWSPITSTCACFHGGPG